jgi:hypothetical protein
MNLPLSSTATMRPRHRHGRARSAPLRPPAPSGRSAGPRRLRRAPGKVSVRWQLSEVTPQPMVRRARGRDLVGRPEPQARTPSRRHRLSTWRWPRRGGARALVPVVRADVAPLLGSAERLAIRFSTSVILHVSRPSRPGSTSYPLYGEGLWMR